MINKAPAKKRPPTPTPPQTGKPSAFPLWTVTEALCLVALNIGIFAFFLAGEKYVLIAELFAPVAIVAAAGLAIQAALLLRNAPLRLRKLNALRAIAQLNVQRTRAQLSE